MKHKNTKVMSVVIPLAIAVSIGMVSLFNQQTTLSYRAEDDDQEAIIAVKETFDSQTMSLHVNAPEINPTVVVATPTPTPEPVATPTIEQKQIDRDYVIPESMRYGLMVEAGMSIDEIVSAGVIIDKESSWRPAVINEYGCIGLAQSCPVGSGLSKQCPDWETNYVCQLQHFDGYAKSKYGSWHRAVQVHHMQNWW